jgi:hypothetical protein
MLIWKNLLYEADKGNGGSEDGKQNTDDASGKTGGDNKPFAVFKDEKEFQDAIDKRLADRLERERKKSEVTAQKAREEAEAKSLAEQQKYQELAEKRAKALTDLEASTADLTGKFEAEQARAQRYEKALTAMLTEQRKRVPEHLHGLLDKLPVDEQLTWIATNGDKLTSSVGVPATPKQQQAPTAEQVAEARRRAQSHLQSTF